MQKFKITFWLVVVVFFVTTGTSFAMSHSHHGSHHSVSPFDKAKELPYHCALNGHSMDNPCPHLSINLNENKMGSLAAECAGSSVPKQSMSKGAAKHKLFSSLDESIFQPYCFSLFSRDTDYSFLLHNPPFHPPRFI